MFYIYLYKLPLPLPLCLCVKLSYCLVSTFFFNLEGFLQYLCGTEKQPNKSSQFLSVTVLISTSSLKDSVARYRILGWQSFFFQHFDLVIAPLSGLPDIWWEISLLLVLIEKRLCMINCLSLDSFKIFSLS